MKKAVISLILILLLAVPVLAAGSGVVDDAGLLDQSELSALDSKAKQIRNSYYADIMILTVHSLNGYSAQTYSDNYYDNNGLGKGSTKSGVLLVVSMSERQWAVTTNGDAYKAISNSDLDDIMDDVLPYLSDGDYFTAFDVYLDGISHELSTYTPGSTEDDGLSLPIQILICLGIGAAVSGIVLLILRYMMNTSRKQSGAVNYMVSGSYDLLRCNDFFLYSRVTKTRKPQNNNSGRSGGGGSRGGRSGSF